MGPVTSNSLRAAAGRLALKVYPRADERAYFRARSRDRAERRRQHDAMERFTSLGESTAPVDRPAHVVVVPHEGSDFPSWAPGTRNFYFEAAESLSEDAGSHRVSVFHVPRGEPWHSWQPRLLDYLLSTDATHLLTHAESDPGSLGEYWTWDSFWEVAHRVWPGVFLGVMFDSSYRFIQAKSKILARMSPHFLVVDICMPMDGSMRRGRPEVGPVNMPMSRRSMGLVAQRIADVEPNVDISFIGVLYPYRLDLIEQLRQQGLSVAVNPHRPEGADTEATSREAQPGWLDYMAGLAMSRATLNFSQSSAGPYQQLKTRVIEAGLAGTLLVTDDVDRTDRFWDRTDFASFTSLDNLPAVLDEWMGDEIRSARARLRFAERARQLAPTHFWRGIDEGLLRRGLPTIGFAGYAPGERE